MTARRYIMVLTTTILLTASLSACVSVMEMDKSKELEPVQVKEYKGEKLSSIADFHENSIKGSQPVDISTYKLFVAGLVENEKSYSYEDIIYKHRHYQKLITLECVEGWSVKILWEGVLVKDLLSEAGIKSEAEIVIFHAVDGYTTSLPLQYILNQDIILAFKMNGMTIPPARGFPFQLAAQDRWGYKWIKWVDKIELSENKNYMGYWEKAGYSNDGALDKPFFDR